MYSKPREKTLAIVKDKLAEKVHRVSNAIMQLSEYINVINSLSAELRNVSRLLSSTTDSVIKTLQVDVVEGLEKTSQGALTLLEDQRSVCQRVKEDGQQSVEFTSHFLGSGQKQIVEQYSQVSQRLEDNFISALVLMESQNMEATEKLTSILSTCALQVSKLPEVVTDILQPIKVTITEMQSVLEMLRKEESPTLNFCTCSESLEEITSGELSSNFLVLSDKPEEVHQMLSPTECIARDAVCVDCHLIVNEVEAAMACTDEMVIPYLELEPGMRLNAIITGVSSSLKITVQLCSQELVELAQMLKESIVQGQPLIPKKYQYCCGRFSVDQCWYRAKVMNTNCKLYGIQTIASDERVRVLYVDYGNEEEIPTSEIRPIDPKFCTMPAQALFCTLLMQSADLNCDMAASIQQWLSQIIVGLPSSVMIESYGGENNAVGDIEVAAALLLSEHSLKSLEDISGVMPDIIGTNDEMVSISVVLDSVVDGVKQLLELTSNSPDSHHTHDSEYSKIELGRENSTMPNLCERKCISEEIVSLPLENFVLNSEGISDQSGFEICGLQHGYGANAEHENSCKNGDGNIVSDVHEQFWLGSGSEKRKRKCFKIVRHSMVVGDTFTEESHKKVDQRVHFTGSSCVVNVTKGIKDMDTIPVHSVLNSNEPFMAKQSQDVGVLTSPLGVSSHLLFCHADDKLEMATPCHSHSGASCDAFMRAEHRSPDIQQSSVEMCNPADISVASPSVLFQFQNQSNSDSSSDSCLKMNIKPFCLKIEGDTPSFLLMMSHIYSVLKFYVHPVQHTSPTLLDLETSLNDCYSRPGVQHLHYSHVRRGTICCIKCTGDKMWYRAVVSEVWSTAEPLEGKCCVFYFDYGVSETVSTTALKVLFPQFLSVPAQCICCSLTHFDHCSKTNCVGDEESENSLLNNTQLSQKSQGSGNFSSDSEMKAMTKNGDASLHEKNGISFDSLSNASVKESGILDKKQWCIDKTTQYFHHLVMEKQLAAFVTKASVTSDPVDSCFGPIYSLLLYNTVGDSNILINEVLLDMESAVCNTNIAEFPALHSHSLAAWNPMEHDYFSERNLYLIDDEDVGSVFLGYKGSENRICRFFSKGQHCWKGDSCHFQHLQEGMVDCCVHEVFGYPHLLTLPPTSSWLVIIATAVLSPNSFCAQILEGINEESAELSDLPQNFTTLVKEMDSYYHASWHGLGVDNPCPGELVAAWCDADEHWYRALVQESLEEHIQVYYVDLGMEENVTRSKVKSIEEVFVNLPIQLVECCLSETKFMGGTPESEDYDQARRMLRSCVSNKLLLARVVWKRANRILGLEVYNFTSKEKCPLNKFLIDRGVLHNTGPVISSRLHGKFEIELLPG